MIDNYDCLFYSLDLKISLYNEYFMILFYFKFILE